MSSFNPHRVVMSHSFSPSVVSVQEGAAAWSRDSGGHHGLLLVSGLGAGCCSLICFPGHDLNPPPFSGCRIDPPTPTITLKVPSIKSPAERDSMYKKTRGHRSSDMKRLVSPSQHKLKCIFCPPNLAAQWVLFSVSFLFCKCKSKKYRVKLTKPIKTSRGFLTNQVSHIQYCITWSLEPGQRYKPPHS